MPVVWGLDLREIQWGKFKGSYMFNRDYHLRRSKMIVYQCAMILCVCSESLGTAALSDYVKEQSQIQALHSSARVHNDDFIGIASFNIFVGVAIATIFGAGFFFDLFWPERHESKSVRLSWKISAVVVSMMGLADALALTVIVATHAAYVTADTADQLAIAEERINPPLVYRHNGRAIAAVVFLWPGWVATVASTCILFASHFHDDVYGPKTAHLRQQQEKDVEIRRASGENGVLPTHSHQPSSVPARPPRLAAYKSGRWSDRMR